MLYQYLKENYIPGEPIFTGDIDIPGMTEENLRYVSYYFMVQLRQIFFYWVLGMVIGSFISVFAKDAIHGLFGGLKDKKMGLWGVAAASLLGIASPLCMYGTIPIAASFSRQGMRDDWLAAFMMSSILLNPQLLLYSTALGRTAFLVRLISCIVCGIAAGLMVHFFFRGKTFFHFDGFEPGEGHDTDPNLFLRFLKNLGRNVKATGLYFLAGVLLSALFQRYVPADAFAGLFGEGNEGFWAAAGGNHRRAVICLRRRDYPAAFAVAFFGNEHGRGSLVYDHRAGDKNHQFGRIENCSGTAAFSIIYRLCDGIFAADRRCC